MYKEKNRGSIGGRKLGKKEGAKGCQRVEPKDEEVTEEKVFSLSRYPNCHNRVGSIIPISTKEKMDIKEASQWLGVSERH
ncbi:MAG TPA: hypothetical protein VHT73_13820 [Thermodesulfobacteriota bacterium]|nr:hypothetical protein [Thermodesulfobacteriota bacterium]